MIDQSQIREILSLYQKYGWTLQRVLLTQALRDEISDRLDESFGAAEIVLSEIDAVWLSRLAQNGGETWELRYLSPNPYALLEVFDADDDEDVREETLMEIEERLKQTIGNKKKESH